MRRITGLARLIIIAAELVVKLALLLVAQGLIGLVDLLELRLRLFVVRVAVGVQLAREFAIGLLDFLLIGLALNSQDLIVVSGHLRSTPYLHNGSTLCFT